MSSAADYTWGTFHICLRAKGDQKRVELFHAVMVKCDADWPFRSFRQGSRTRICEKCKGGVVTNPRFGPEDIKAAAKQCGIVAKVDRFFHEENCYNGSVSPTIIYFMRDEADKLLKMKAKNVVIEGSSIRHKSEVLDGAMEEDVADDSSETTTTDASTALTIVHTPSTTYGMPPPTEESAKQLEEALKEAKRDGLISDQEEAEIWSNWGMTYPIQ